MFTCHCFQERYTKSLEKTKWLAQTSLWWACRRFRRIDRGLSHTLEDFKDFRLNLTPSFLPLDTPCCSLFRNNPTAFQVHASYPDGSGGTISYVLHKGDSTLFAWVFWGWLASENLWRSRCWRTTKIGQEQTACRIHTAEMFNLWPSSLQRLVVLRFGNPSPSTRRRDGYVVHAADIDSWGMQKDPGFLNVIWRRVSYRVFPCWSLHTSLHSKTSNLSDVMCDQLQLIMGWSFLLSEVPLLRIDLT